MSDTYAADDQSIDDQRDTATGGLQNDMPSLPVEPPSRPPSALGGLAASLFGGRPPPQPAGPGPSPWEAPGRSQIPQGSPGGPQSHQNASRWRGTTASLALPQGSMQPQANFSPFMPGPRTTSHTQWGQSEPFPNLPQSFEAPGLLGGLSKFFGQNGSAAIIPLALSMGKNGGAFLDAVMKGEEWAAKERRQKLKDDAEQLAIRQGKEMTEYFDVVNEYATSAGAKSGEAAKNYSINGETLLDALANKATELGDDKLLAVLGTGSVDKALQFLHERNDNWNTLDKTNKAVEKQDAQDREEMSTWGQTFGGGATGGGKQPSPSDVYAGSGNQPQPNALSGGQPAPHMNMPADQTQQQSQDPTHPSPDMPWASDAPNVQEAERLAATGRGVKLEDKRANDWIASRALSMQDWVDKNIVKNKAIGPDILDKDGNLISSPVEDALNRSLGGHFAEDSRGIAYYTQGLGGGQTGGGGGGGPEQNYNKLLQDLASKRRPGDLANGVPGYQQRNYQLITDFDKNGQVTQTIRRLGTFSTTGSQLKEAIDNLPKNLSKADETALQTAVANVMQGKYAGDQRFVALANAWNNYSIEKNVLLRGGVGGIGETKESMGVTGGIFARPEDYRTALVQDAQNAYQRAESLKKQYRDLGGQGDPPGWSREDFDATKALANVEPVNGKQPGETVDTPLGPAIWRGYYDGNGRAIPPNKRYQRVNP